jgi:protein O-GlcNAc transferase
MRIAFTDFTDADYTVATPLVQPLGGTQSAACYLCRRLAEMGHQIFLVNRTSTPGVFERVEHLKLVEDEPEQFAALNLDALVAIQQPLHGKYLKAAVGENVRLVLLAQDAAGEPLMEPLLDPIERDAFDGMAMVSDWQMAGHRRQYGIAPERMRVLRNAIGPSFENLFGDGRGILPRKAWPPILAYTSAPYRGLSLLLDAFGPIHASVPGARLRVFSSMKVYQQSARADAQKYGALYERCEKMDGVEYVGGLAQPELARQLMEVSILAYANNYPETSSIAVMEGMAAGCRVVTSDRGALPETCGGFGRLVSCDQSAEQFAERYAEEVVAALKEMRDQPAATEDLLQRQVAWVNRECIWKKKAEEWIDWLSGLAAHRPRLTLARLRESKRDILLAGEHLRAGRLAETLECCRRVLVDQPDNAHALYLSGAAELQSGRGESALELLQRAVKGNPSSATYRGLLGLAYGVTGNHQASIAEFCEAIVRQPVNPVMYNNLGIVLGKEGRLAEAIAAFGKAISQRPDYAEAYNNLGSAEQARGNWEQAIVAYQNALTHRPDFSSARQNLEFARQHASR